MISRAQGGSRETRPPSGWRRWRALQMISRAQGGSRWLRIWRHSTQDLRPKSSRTGRYRRLCPTSGGSSVSACRGVTACPEPMLTMCFALFSRRRGANETEWHRLNHDLRAAYGHDLDSMTVHKEGSPDQPSAGAGAIRRRPHRGGVGDHQAPAGVRGEETAGHSAADAKATGGFLGPLRDAVSERAAPCAFAGRCPGPCIPFRHAAISDMLMLTYQTCADCKRHHRARAGHVHCGGRLRRGLPHLGNAIARMHGSWRAARRACRGLRCR